MRERIETGSGHAYEFVTGDAGTWLDVWPQPSEHFPAALMHHEGDGDTLVLVGIIEHHLRVDNGEPCDGGVMFARPKTPSEHEAKRPVWQVISLVPLHIEPSILCGCGAHGFIRDDVWVDA